MRDATKSRIFAALYGSGDVRDILDFYKVYLENQMATPHKHEAVIKAWADGQTIQAKNDRGFWVTVPGRPSFDPEVTYRVKPATVRKQRAFVGVQEGGFFVAQYPMSRQNVEFSFDSESGELLDVRKL